MSPLPEIPPVVVRSRAILALASELVGDEAFRAGQAMVSFREQGATDWQLRFFGSDAPEVMERVAEGAVDLAIVNPGALLTVANRGGSLLGRRLALRAIGVLPSPDELVLAVNPQTGIETFQEMLDRRSPLRVSMRGQADHSLHWVIEDVFAAGFASLEELKHWGGSVTYDAGLPLTSGRVDRLIEGRVDAVFDEAAETWVGEAASAGMRFLALDDCLLDRLESQGYRRSWLRRGDYVGLSSDVPTLDYSHFPLYVREECDDAFVQAICRALKRACGKIVDQTGSPLHAEQMLFDVNGERYEYPFHPAAERFWLETLQR